MTEIKIRSAVEADCDLILSLIQGLADYEKMSDDVVATVDDLKATLFKQQQAEVFIGELNGEPVGFALFFHSYSTFLGKRGLYLEDLFIIPEARGKGVGKALLVHLAKIALDRDCARFEWSVLDWNQPAIDFYRSIGAVGMEEWTVQRVDGDALQKLAKL
ncbi:MAG: GNAT family N-acetyltransferase [Enterobacterales bacterium]|nr:GNAT family N-acetyltransferase [Enterobacterales bacterium]